MNEQEIRNYIASRGGSLNKHLTAKQLENLRKLVGDDIATKK